MRLLLEVRKITIVVGIVVMLFALITYVDGLLNRTRAKRLVSALQTVRVGTTTLAEIDGLAGRYGGRRRQPCEAELCNVDFSPIQNTLLARAHLAPATRFGATV